MRPGFGVWLLAMCCAAPSAQPPAPLTLATSQGPDTLAGKMQLNIYAEAARRLGIGIRLVEMPLQRASAAVERGQIDGEVARARAYAEAHPTLVRVDQVIYEVQWALYAVDARVRPTRLEELRATPWRATYPRGAGVCERALRQALPPDRITDVSTDAQGFAMLRAGRSDLHCTADVGALTLQASPEFRDIDITRRATDIGATPLYPFLNAKHDALAPRLAQVLRQMVDEGLIERYRVQALADLHRH